MRGKPIVQEQRGRVGGLRLQDNALGRIVVGFECMGVLIDSIAGTMHRKGIGHERSLRRARLLGSQLCQKRMAIRADLPIPLEPSSRQKC